MKVSLYLQKDKDPERECILYVRLRNSEEVKTINTNIKCKSKHFKNGFISPSTPNFKQKSQLINSILYEVEGIILEIEKQGFSPSPSLVQKGFKDRQETKRFITPKIKTFWICFDEFYDTKRNKSRGYTKTLITLKNHLLSFEEYEGKPITFDYIVGKTPLFTSNLYNYLWEIKGSSNGYINKLVSNLSNFLFWCKENGYIKKRPRFRPLQTVDVDEKIYLKTDEVLKLFENKKWDFEIGRNNYNEHIHIIKQELLGTNKKRFGTPIEENNEIKYYSYFTSWEVVKDLFLFMCSVGCRYSDLEHFIVDDFDFDSSLQTFSWVQQKTQKRVKVPKTDISGSVFVKYSRGKRLDQRLFPPFSQQKFNKQLKLLLRDLKFKRLVSKPKMVGSKTLNTQEKELHEVISSHSGRRSYIKNLIDLGEMDYKSIMKLSGHRSITEFLKYVSVNEEDLKKGSNLYRLENKTEDEEIEEVVKIYKSLQEEEKVMIRTILDRFRK